MNRLIPFVMLLMISTLSPLTFAQATGTCTTGTQYCEGSTADTNISSTSNATSTATSTNTNNNNNVNTSTSTSNNTNTNTNTNTNNNTNVNTSTSTNVNTNNNVMSGGTTNTNTNNNTSTSTNTNTNNNTNVNTSTNNNTNTNTSTNNNTNNNTNTNTSTSTSNNVNSNTSESVSDNTNTNINSSTSESVSTSNSTSKVETDNTNNNNNVNQNINQSESVQTVNQKIESPPPSAIAPSIGASFSQDLCTTGVSGAVQTQIFGLAAGKSITDTNCERIKLAKTIYDMGMRVAAVSLMCQDERVWTAMKMAGTPCPYQGMIGDEAGVAWEENLTDVPGVSERDVKKDRVTSSPNMPR
jgi:hypothetical protein